MKVYQIFRNIGEDGCINFELEKGESYLSMKSAEDSIKNLEQEDKISVDRFNNKSLMYKRIYADFYIFPLDVKE